MDFKVLITDSALSDLREIVKFIAEEDPRAAARLGDKLITFSLTLGTMPERHAYHDERRAIRKMPRPPYLIFYSIDAAASVVNVLHFWHGARRSPEFTK